MGRRFLSLEYDATPVVIPLPLPQLDDDDHEASLYPTPKKWSLLDPFDPDSDEFFIRDDAVYEAFISDEMAKRYATSDAPISIAVTIEDRESDAAARGSSINSPSPETALAAAEAMHAAGWEIVMSQVPSSNWDLATQQSLVTRAATTIPITDDSVVQPTLATTASITVPLPPSSPEPPARLATRPPTLPPFGARVRNSGAFARLIHTTIEPSEISRTTMTPAETNDPLPVNHPLIPNTATPPAAVVARLPSTPQTAERFVRAWRTIIQHQENIPSPLAAGVGLMVDTRSGLAPLR